MKTRVTGRRKRREGWSNRLAIIGITVVVLSLALVVNIKNHSMEKKVMEPLFKAFAERVKSHSDCKSN